MSEETTPFVEYEVPGVGTVIDPQGEPGYRVRLPDGQVTAYPAQSLAPSEANAAADIAYAIAHPAPQPAPLEVSPLQMRCALNAAGLRATVETAVAASDQETRDAWEFATAIRRDNVLLSAMAAQLGLTTAQVDDLFRSAASFN